MDHMDTIIGDPETSTIQVTRNGRFVSGRSFRQPGVTDVTPVPGDAPLRIGTRDFASFFQGRICGYALFDRELRHTLARVAMGPPAVRPLGEGCYGCGE